MKTDEGVRKYIQERFQYTEREVALFFDNPRNLDVISKAGQFANKTIVFEVIESRGCNSGHRTGDRLFFDAAGNLLTKRSPERICVYALQATANLIFAAGELIMAGVDPNEMRFKRAACFDVGVDCGGWGRVVLEMRVEERP